MSKKLFRTTLITAITALLLSGCENETLPADEGTPPDTERWITVAGALMGENPGDGNGGTMVYAVSYEDARDPNISINVFEEGFGVKSNRTARLQSSEDGNTLFNIAYTGENGGEFSRYKVNGGKQFIQEDVSVSMRAARPAGPNCSTGIGPASPST